MLVLTVGNSYVDIDGYASCIAYRELLKMRGEEAMFVTNALFNYSITNSLLESSYIKDDYTVSEEDTFIVLDLSNKEYFPRFVKEEKIVELIDHHRGFEEYWNSKLGDRAIIESIGAVATIIVEKYEQYNMFQKMDKKIALLLMAAILDNTLNFTADITSDRDIRAYKRLQELTGEIDYADIYFKESQEAILNNIEEAIVNDIKYQKENDKLPPSKRKELRDKEKNNKETSKSDVLKIILIIALVLIILLIGFYLVRRFIFTKQVNSNIIEKYNKYGKKRSKDDSAMLDDAEEIN